MYLPRSSLRWKMPYGFSQPSSYPIPRVQNRNSIPKLGIERITHTGAIFSDLSWDIPEAETVDSYLESRNLEL